MELRTSLRSIMAIAMAVVVLGPGQRCYWIEDH